MKGEVCCRICRRVIAAKKNGKICEIKCCVVVERDDCIFTFGVMSEKQMKKVYHRNLFRSN